MPPSEICQCGAMIMIVPTGRGRVALEAGHMVYQVTPDASAAGGFSAFRLNSENFVPAHQCPGEYTNEPNQ